MSLLPHLKYKGFIRPPFPFFSAPSSFVARSLFGLLISHGFLIGKNDGLARRRSFPATRRRRIGRRRRRRRPSVIAFGTWRKIPRKPLAHHDSLIRESSFSLTGCCFSFFFSRRKFPARCISPSVLISLC